MSVLKALDIMCNLINPSDSPLNKSFQKITQLTQTKKMQYWTYIVQYIGLNTILLLDHQQTFEEMIPDKI